MTGIARVRAQAHTPRHGGTLGAMAPRRKDEHRLEIDPAFLRALAERITRAGETTVRQAAGVSKQSMWRVMRPAKSSTLGDQAPTFELVERLRIAVMAEDPDGPPIPSPFTPVGGPATWKAALQMQRKRR